MPMSNVGGGLRIKRKTVQNQCDSTCTIFAVVYTVAVVPSRRGWQPLWSLQTPSSTGCAILLRTRDPVKVFRRSIVIYDANVNISDAEASRKAARTLNTFGHVGSRRPSIRKLCSLLALMDRRARWFTTRHVTSSLVLVTETPGVG